MQINNRDNINFKTKIIFSSPQKFRNVCEKIRSNAKHENITFWDVKPEHLTLFLPKNSPLYGYRKILELGYTEGVKSCSAGIVAKKGDNAPLFFHIQDTVANIFDFNSLKSSFKGSNAVLVGSKPQFTISCALFNRIKEICEQQKLPTTIMQGLKQGWETDLAYISETDTLYLCVKNNLKDDYVDSLKKARKVFQTINISPKDIITFL